MSINNAPEDFLRSLAGLMAIAPYKFRYWQIVDLIKIWCDSDQVKFNLRFKRIDDNGLRVEVERFSKNTNDDFVGDGGKVIPSANFVGEIFSPHFAPIELMKEIYPSSIASLEDASWHEASLDLDGISSGNFFLKVSVHFDVVDGEQNSPNFVLDFRDASPVPSITVLDVDRCRLAMTDGKSLIQEALNDPEGFGIGGLVASEIKKSVETHWPIMFSLVEAAMISASVQTPSASATPAPAKKNGRRI